MNTQDIFSAKISGRDESPLSRALAQLRLRLLDLTGRNRLLNFRHTAGKSLQFVEGQPKDIYNKLVESNTRSSILINGLSEPNRKDWVERNGRLSRPDQKEWALQQGIPISFDLPEPDTETNQSNVRALHYLDDLAKHCRKIEREATLAIEETGANMLFLVLGFLEFPDQTTSEKIFTAPLISIPVSISKRDSSGIQTFSLQYTGEDIAENLSLREKLKNDYGLLLPELDEDSIDVEGYYHSIQQLIKARPGFSFRRRTSLCLLSFTNMLLLRDIDPAQWPKIHGTHSLLDHPIIREVFEGNPNEAAEGFNIAKEHPVEEGAGAKIPLIYDADSSQHSALVDVLSEGKNLVIEGPPGTGKSQTITNLIAACLTTGKRVLFVSEKLAALEVVKNRLTLAGLDPFVLELHSNKTNKKRVLEEIGKRIHFRPEPQFDLDRKMQQLDIHRNDLKSYADMVNSVTHNAFGLTLHQIIWRAEKHRLAISADISQQNQLNVEDASEISQFELSRRMDCLGHLSSQFKIIGSFNKANTFWGFFPEHFIPGDDIKLKHYFSESLDWSQQFRTGVAKYAELLNCTTVKLTFDLAKSQVALLTSLLNSIDERKPLHLMPKFFASDSTGMQAKNLLQSLSDKIRRYNSLEITVNEGLKSETPISQSDIEWLRKIDHSSSLLSLTLGTPDEIRNLSDSIKREYTRLSNSSESIRAFCKKKKIPFDESRNKTLQLARLIHLILDCPEDFLHLQNPRLAKEGCLRSLQHLVNIQQQWTQLQTDLTEVLYIDNLPSVIELKKAINTFREGHTWFRIFQKRWRSAIAMHKRLQRFKQNVNSRARLDQLEKMALMLNIKELWKSDPSWEQYLGFQEPKDDFSLSGHLALLKWNLEVDVLMEDLQTKIFSPSELTLEKLHIIRREYASINLNLSEAIAALKAIDSLLPTYNEKTNILDNKTLLSVVSRFQLDLESKLDWLQIVIKNNVKFNVAKDACEAAIERSEIETSINTNGKIKNLLVDKFHGIKTDVTEAIEVLLLGQDFDRLDLVPSIKEKLKAGHPVEQAKLVILALERVLIGLSKVVEFETKLNSFGHFNLNIWVDARPEDDLIQFADKLNDRIESALKDVEMLVPWSLYVMRRREANEFGLTNLAVQMENEEILPVQLADYYAYSTYATIVREVFRLMPQLGQFSGLKHNQIKEEFKRLDKEVIRLRGKAIGVQCHQSAQLKLGRNGARVDDKTEMVLLNYLLPQQRPRMPVRKMLTRASTSIQSLKPCFMMGPQAVAQYLTPGVIKFDLVIMDEASQLRPEEALGAIARGSQLVVVGDPKQLPPTSFFSRINQAGDDEEQYTTTDAESILDVCAGHFHPIRTLRWHYRSQHHSLIAFSNQHFYRNNLIVFPSPYGQSNSLGVRATYLAEAIYDNQTNLKEAKRVVDTVVEHILHRPSDSLGVVTLNIKQRDLIAELLDERLRTVPGADKYREEWASVVQPLFIKNLENVQGDERDSIIISTTFGKPPGSNVVRQNFGPISRQGGWRRLNVLFTRARKSIAIYTSLRPEDIIVDGTTPEGTKALRNYLEYARTGSLTVAENTNLEPDSDFEVAVINILRARGFEVTPQLGVAGYRIDIAVKHPDAPGSYLAAVECDGASYHSALSIRDRDRIRQEILESLGWRGRIWRIWSTDWFRAPRQETEKLMTFLNDLRKNWKPEHLSVESWVEEGTPSIIHEDSVRASQAEERQVINEVLLQTEDEIGVDVGDEVKYIDVVNPHEILKVSITQKTTDLTEGLISEDKPLAQILLGAVVGDEITLPLNGKQYRIFRIIEIIRPKKRIEVK